MFKLILNRYLFFGLVLNLIMITSLDIEYISIYFFNIFSVVSYYFLLYSAWSKPDSYFNRSRLVLFVVPYSFFFVFSFNAISYYFNGNYFVFNEIDAVFYHDTARRIVDLSILDGFKFFLLRFGGTLEDFGAILVISTLYKIVVSNLTVNIFYMLIGVQTSLAIYRIGSNFMSRKYAFLSALTYSTSSFVLYYHATGLKETIMIFFIVFFYDQYYKFILNKRILNVLLMSFSLLSMFLFRPVIVVFIIGSILATVLISKRKSKVTFTVIPLIFILGYFAYDFMGELSSQFIGSDVDSMLKNKEEQGMVIINLPFTIATNVLSTFFGPFPTLLPGDKMHLSFYSVGLILRILISTSFWIGVYYVYREKVNKILPLIFFVIFEGFSLTFILEGLELRKTLPHLFSIYIVAFWFLDYFQNWSKFSVKSRKRIFKSITFSITLFFFLILIWNFKDV